MSRKKRPQNIHTAHFPVSNLYTYDRYEFGQSSAKGNALHVYCITDTISKLACDFEVFEKIPKASYWPVKQIIQREVDYKRVKEEIARGYLQENGSTPKFFPPLTAVLVPLQDNKLPLDGYEQELDNAFWDFCKNRHKNDFWEGSNLNTEKSIQRLAVIEFDQHTGQMLWDTQLYQAVILDGQHRFEALRYLKDNEDSRFSEWKVQILILDLFKEKQNLLNSVRGIFIAINSTPNLVDESRLILMNNLDPRALIVQEILDDSTAENLHLSPYCIDWEGKKGKHTWPYLTGVITLEQIVHIQFFGSLDITNSDVKTNYRKVRKWSDQVGAWAGSEVEIKIKKLIDQSIIEDEVSEEDQGPNRSIYFSITPELSREIADKFKELRLESLVKVYTELAPYKQYHSIAQEYEITKPNSELYEYYRVSKSKREEKLNALSDTQVKNRIERYEKKQKDEFEEIFLFTVMGQKALFMSLNDFLLNGQTIDLQSGDAISSATMGYIEIFNKRYEKCNPFMLNLKKTFKQKGKQSNRMPYLKFWEGLIYRGGKILYTQKGIEILKAFLSLFVSQKSDLDAYPNKKELSESFRETINSLQKNMVLTLQQSLKIGTTEKAEAFSDEAIALAEEKIRYFIELTLKTL